jgi:hypothetical protein
MFVPKRRRDRAPAAAPAPDPREPTAAEVRAVVDEVLAPLGERPCSDSGCIFGPPGGQMTNGGCRCVRDAAIESRATLPAFYELAGAIRNLATEVARQRKAATS